AIVYFRLGFQAGDADLPLMEWVKSHKRQGDLYLIPVKIPSLSTTTRGSHSSDFEPLQEKKTDAAIIPVNLQQFRLHAEAPIFVDFKSIPYKDVEVLEWHERLQQNQQFYDQLRAGNCADVQRHGITHVVLPRDQSIVANGME